MKKQLIIPFLCIISLCLQARGQATTFFKVYGGPGNEQGRCVRPTADGGYIVAGYTTSFNSTNYDWYIIKTDANGDPMWTRTIAGPANDRCADVQPTLDGGYLMCGLCSNYTGGNDATLAKLTGTGDFLGMKTYSWYFYQVFNSILTTPDSGFIAMGYSNSSGWSNNDVYLVRVNANGDTLWVKSFGGILRDEGNCIRPTMDGGYIIAGTTYSFGVAASHVYLIKTDANGNRQWEKTIGGAGVDEGWSVQQTPDSGYIVSGFTQSYGNGDNDVYLIKTDKNGNYIWTKTYGGSGDDRGRWIEQTHDGGFVIAGWTNSFGDTTYAAYLIRTDANGNLLWSKTYGGTGEDYAYCVMPTWDGGFILTGGGNSLVTGLDNLYLIKTDSLGNTGCEKSDPPTVVGTWTPTHSGDPESYVTPPPLFVYWLDVYTSSGAAVTTLCETIGVEELNSSHITINIFPNPALSCSQVTVTYPASQGTRQLYIIDAIGREVAQHELSPGSTEQNIILPELSSGVYVARVTGDKVSANAKFVVQ